MSATQVKEKASAEDKEQEAAKAKLQQWVKDEVQKELRDELVKGGVNRPDVSGNLGDGVTNSSRRIFSQKIASWAGAPGVALNDAFPSFGDFVRQITPRALATNGLPAAIRNLSSVEPSAGGFLVPEGFRSELLAIALDDAIVRGLATVIPMTSSKQVVPAIDVTTNETTLFGGVDAQWIPEGGTFSDTGPRFGRIMLEANKLGLRTDVPSELLQDASPALDVLLLRLFAASLGFEEDGAFINGNGVGQPLGFLNAPATIVVAKETNQPDGTIVYANLTKMFARMLSRSRRRAVWVVSDEAIPELLELSIAVGTGGSHVPVMREVDGQFQILGRPVNFTEHASQLGVQGDISLCDFGYYLIGDRAEMRLESSEHVKFLSDEVVFRGIERVDGRPWIQSPITPRNGGDTRSAFVTLGARP